MRRMRVTLSELVEAAPQLRRGVREQGAHLDRRKSREPARPAPNRSYLWRCPGGNSYEHSTRLQSAQGTCAGELAQHRAEEWRKPILPPPRVTKQVPNKLTLSNLRPHQYR